MVVAFHRPGGQAQFSRRPLPELGAGLVRTCDWAVAEMHRPPSVHHLARHAARAPRTFAWLFRAETNMTGGAHPLEQGRRAQTPKSPTPGRFGYLTFPDVRHVLGVRSGVAVGCEDRGAVPSVLSRTCESVMSSPRFGASRYPPAHARCHRTQRGFYLQLPTPKVIKSPGSRPRTGDALTQLMGNATGSGVTMSAKRCSRRTTLPSRLGTRGQATEPPANLRSCSSALCGLPAPGRCTRDTLECR